MWTELNNLLNENASFISHTPGRGGQIIPYFKTENRERRDGAIPSFDFLSVSRWGWLSGQVKGHTTRHSY